MILIRKMIRRAGHGGSDEDLLGGSGVLAESNFNSQNTTDPS